MRVELAQDGLQMALQARPVGPGLIHHTDRGSQYTSHEYHQMLRDNGVTSSMSRKGEYWDNAVAESFFGRLKEELTHGQKFEIFREAIEEVDHYIKSFYYTQRAQRRLGNVSPVEYELRYAALKAA